MCMDDTLLIGKYKGDILTAIATAENNQVLPMAFAFVESENTYSWLWFLANIKRAVVGDRPNVCLITDSNAELLSTLNTIENGTQPPSNRTMWKPGGARAILHQTS